MRFIVPLLVCASTVCAAPKFRPQEIQRDFGVVYAVNVADMNGDGKPDIVAIGPAQAVWYENPTWEKHIVLDGATKKDNVAFDVYDVDGDGHPDLALAADWQPRNTQSGGSLQWITRQGAPAGGLWRMTPIGAEPTLHRIRWADVTGDGRKELVALPLHGRGNTPPEWQGDGLRVLVYRIPADPFRDPWKPEIADETLHIAHNFIVTDLDGDGREEIVTASREGVHALKRSPSGEWSRRKIGEGQPGEIKLGRTGRTRRLATVEPWHGNSIVVYSEAEGLWPRETIENELAGAHALGWGDFSGDGNEALAVGWREKGGGVAVYQRDRAGSWTKTMVDGGEMATEDMAVADLNGDGLPEIIAGGRATQNIRIYWNETQEIWTRHVVAEGFPAQTAVATDVNGDGLKDVITNGNGQTLLYVAPDWRKTVLHSGVNAIHSELIDVDGDGRMDFIGARYSPGLIYWLEQPANALRDPWRYHVVDSSAIGGVDGIHGLITGDVDGDGKLDLIGNSAQPKGPFANSLAWFRVPPNPRTAQHWERYIFAAGDAPGLSHYLGFGDVNGDGRPDIASAAKIPEGGNWFAWWEAPADPRQRGWKKHVIAENHEGATNILMADVNGDGIMDFIATRGHGKGVLWFEGPDWKMHVIHPDLEGPHSLAIGDIDGDGDIDAVTCAKDDFVVAWFENDGKGNFTTHFIHHDQAAYDIRLVDMDNDGDLDVLVAGQNSRNVTWYENRLHGR